MRPAVLLLALATLASCAPTRWPLKPTPESPQLTLSERYEIVRDGMVSGGPLGDIHWYFSWDERLAFLYAPVTVVAVQRVSHGVFREKWANNSIVVSDRYGTLFDLGEVPLPEAKPGDVLRAKP